MRVAEVRRQLHTLHARKDRTKVIALTPYELMARIEIAVLRDGIVLMPRSASRQSFRHAGTMVEIHVEVEEEEALPRVHAIEISLCQMIVLGEDARQILLGKTKRAVLQHNRLHRQNIKPRLVHREHILREIEVFVRVCPAQIVVIAAARIDELLKVPHDYIIRSVPARIRTHRIMHPAPSIC